MSCLLRFLASPLTLVLLGSTAAAEPPAEWKVQTGPARQAHLAAALQEHDGGLEPAVRKEKDDLMAVSPFSFYRGTAHLFYRDLAAGKLLTASSFAKAVTWVQGDLHVQNFGSFGNDESH